MLLPDDLEREFDRAVVQLEEEEQMPYITLFEQRAEKRAEERVKQRVEKQIEERVAMQTEERTLREAILDILEARFPAEVGGLRVLLDNVSDPKTLRSAHHVAIRTASAAEVREILQAGLQAAPVSGRS